MPKQVVCRTYTDGQLIQLPLSKLTIAETNIRTYEIKHHPKREEEWEMLKQTIKKHGILEPIMISNKPLTISDGRQVYRVISGQRRIKALKEIGDRHAMVPCIAKEFASEEEERIVSYITNIHRKEVHLRDQSNMVEILQKRGFTIEQMAEFMGCSKRHINHLKNYLTHPDEIRRDQLQGAHVPGHETSELGKHFEGKEKKINPERDQEIIDEEAKRFMKMSRRERDNILEAAEKGEDIGKVTEEIEREKARKKTLEKAKKIPDPPFKMDLEDIPGDHDAPEIVSTLHPWVQIPTKIVKITREWFRLSEQYDRHLQVSAESYKKMMALQEKFKQFSRSEILNAIITAFNEEMICE